MVETALQKTLPGFGLKYALLRGECVQPPCHLASRVTGHVEIGAVVTHPNARLRRYRLLDRRRRDRYEKKIART